MKLLTCVVLVLAVLGRGAEAGDCPACTATKLCDPHVAADKEAAKVLREGLGSPDPATRIGAITMFAEACAAHSNCRPAMNAHLLAAALRDPDGTVRGKAAASLGEQDRKTVGPILAKETESLVKMLDKDPKGAKEEAAWLANYECLKGICSALAAMGNEDAGAAMAKMLASTRLKVLNSAAETAPKVRSKLVPPAFIDAIDRVRFSKPGADRDATWINLLKGWEAMTRSGTKSPDPADPSDAIRYVNDCKTWWKANEKTWK